MILPIQHYLHNNQIIQRNDIHQVNIYDGHPAQHLTDVEILRVNTLSNIYDGHPAPHLTDVEILRVSTLADITDMHHNMDYMRWTNKPKKIHKRPYDGHPAPHLDHEILPVDKNITYRDI